ncbi:MAG: hypothetical protein ACLPRE_14790 [Limisphaerales bacterium]
MDLKRVMARKPFSKFSKRRLDQLAADLEWDFRDLPVWQHYVRQFGLKRARQILRQGLLIHEITDGNPEN